MSTKKKMLQAAAGNAGGEALNVEDVFSTYLYEGTGSAITITNGIDLDGEGGMVWLKNRDTASNHSLHDTERTPSYQLVSNSTAAEDTLYGDLSSFNSDGFSLGTGGGGNNISNGSSIASWTFRKAPKFFDVVTYTGTGSAQTISHNLGSAPASMLVKKTSGTEQWLVYHKDLGTTGYLVLNGTNASADSTNAWDDTAPTSSEFTVGTFNNVNQSGQTYVAYLFAHNDGDGEFGPDGDADIIKCGSYTGNGDASGNPAQEIDLGFEPQWILSKRTDSAEDWHIRDVMRGATTDGVTQRLRPNSSAAESENSGTVPYSSGFKAFGGDNLTGGTYIYIAIRRGTKVPESGTEVFAMSEDTANGSYINTGFPVDMSTWNYKSGFSGNSLVNDRIRGVSSNSTYYGSELQTSSTNAEGAISQPTLGWDNTGLYATTSGAIYWLWKRAPNFFDVVAYTGNGTAGRTVSHNLGVAPEMIWCKNRTNSQSWGVLVDPALNGRRVLRLDENQAGLLNDEVMFGDGVSYVPPTATEFTLGADNDVNRSSNDFIAYLFATLDGVSKVFSVTKSSGSDASVNCGFSSGPRFVMLKRTDSTGDWYVWDTERGIIAGNDPYLLLNSTAAEVTSTDYIDPTSNGFTIVNGGLADGDYIGYAVA